MRPEKKRKTFCPHPHPSPRRHYSLQLYPANPTSPQAVAQCIQDLLLKVFHTIRGRQKLAENALKMLARIQLPSFDYFQMQNTKLKQDKVVVSEDEPECQGHAQLRIQHSMNKSQNNSFLEYMRESEAQNQRKMKESMILKLKKQCMTVRSSVYNSATKPVQSQTLQNKQPQDQLICSYRQKKLTKPKNSKKLPAHYNSTLRLHLQPSNSFIKNINPSLSTILPRNVNRSSFVPAASNNMPQLQANMSSSQQVGMFAPIQREKHVFEPGQQKQKRKGSSLHMARQRGARQQVGGKIQGSFHKKGVKIRQVGGSTKLIEDECQGLLPRITRR